ncbi:DUF3348 family protein [Pseudorhodoferax sp. Leaf267]|uniref:DUF3348 family protein n=1 Tax=Pseudorhodoferax sp. Leaf267 TaxID=1736316 RepID=UPI0006FBEF4B|nr:DUF3348 family protein [Pseudorhodoferax sp. Leaf267]KQP18805.1 hypothetical protein ASF43_29200 [Pseudorhodoferax sp. Leaf267]
MVQGSRRAGLADATLVRLLARLTDLDVRESPQRFADRLSDWLRWTDAMSLFTALQDSPAHGAATHAPAPAEPPVDDPEASRIRSQLVESLDEDGPWMPEIPSPRARAHQRTTTPLPVLETKTEFAPYRRHYQGRQIAMGNAIEPLRARLRTRLAARSPDMAALAAVDEVMERVLGEHEHRLLAALPALLERRFARLRAAAEAEPQAWSGWLDAFHQELQAVLAAELELRWQPIEGLLAALHTQHDHA